MSAIAQTYANLIKKGKKTIDQVPEAIREEVMKILETMITSESDAE